MKKAKSNSAGILKSAKFFHSKTIQKLIKQPFEVVAEEGYSRDKYINHLVRWMVGASGEFFTCILHDRLDLHSEFREKWEGEWKTHLHKMFFTLGHNIKFKNREKAIEQAIEEFLEVVNGQLTAAANKIADYHNLPNQDVYKALDKQKDIEAFLVEVHKIIQRYNDRMKNKITIDEKDGFKKK